MKFKVLIYLIVFLSGTLLNAEIRTPYLRPNTEYVKGWCMKKESKSDYKIHICAKQLPRRDSTYNVEGMHHILYIELVGDGKDPIIDEAQFTIFALNTSASAESGLTLKFDGTEVATTYVKTGNSGKLRMRIYRMYYIFLRKVIVRNLELGSPIGISYISNGKKTTIIFSPEEQGEIRLIASIKLLSKSKLK